MQNKLNSKRIDGAALELIMRDVLDGIFDFTSQACSGSETATMEIVAVEAPDEADSPARSAAVIPFRGRSSGD